MSVQAILSIATFAFLFVGSAVFGLKGQAAEMALVVLASALALAFLNIDKIQRFKGGGFEAEMRQQLASIVEAQTEPSPENLPDKVSVSEINFDDRTFRVLRALANPKYTWRYPSGISEELSMPRNHVQGALDRLSDQGLAIFVQGRKGGSIWALTTEGRALLMAEGSQPKRA